MPRRPVPAGQDGIASHSGPTWCLNQILDQISVHSCANHGLKPDDQVCERPGTPHMRGPERRKENIPRNKETFSLGPFMPSQGRRRWKGQEAGQEGGWGFP